MADPSTSPISPTSSSTSSEHDIQTLLLAQINQLSQHHVTVSYTLIAILVLVLGLAGMGGWLGLKSYEAQVSRAETIEAKYQDAQKAFSEQLAANNAERAQDAQASAALIAQIAKRAVAPLPPVIQSGLAVSAPAAAVSSALGSLIGSRHPEVALPTVVGLNVSLEPATAQKVALDELSLTRSEGDLDDTKSLLTLANQDKSTLSKDLDTCTDLNVKANESIAAYRKVAIKSRWRKILDGMEKVGFVLAGVEVGRAL